MKIKHIIVSILTLLYSTVHHGQNFERYQSFSVSVSDKIVVNSEGTLIAYSKSVWDLSNNTRYKIAKGEFIDFHPSKENHVFTFDDEESKIYITNLITEKRELFFSTDGLIVKAEDGFLFTDDKKFLAYKGYPSGFGNNFNAICIYDIVNKRKVKNFSIKSNEPFCFRENSHVLIYFSYIADKKDKDNLYINVNQFDIDRLSGTSFTLETLGANYKVHPQTILQLNDSTILVRISDRTSKLQYIFHNLDNNEFRKVSYKATNPQTGKINKNEITIDKINNKIIIISHNKINWYSTEDMKLITSQNFYSSEIPVSITPGGKKLILNIVGDTPKCEVWIKK